MEKNKNESAKIKKILPALMIVTALMLTLVGVGVRVAGADKPQMLDTSKNPKLVGERQQDEEQLTDSPEGHEKPDPYLIWERQREHLASPEVQSSAADDVNAQTGRQAPTRQGLPTIGTVKIPVLLVDFSDAPHTSTQTVADVQSKMFGTGDKALYPYNSLKNYYERSSDYKLTITGDVYGWYRALYPRGYYEGFVDNEGHVDKKLGRQLLISEAIGYWNARGTNFAQYDNDNNGNIDGIFLKYTGPKGPWDSFWWPCQPTWKTPDLVVDGKRINKYVWSDYGTTYRPKIDMHETGHLLGLPDLYDYKLKEGPCGGVGGLDMMDGNWGDHNCFSKWLLGWIPSTEFVVVSSGSKQVQLSHLALSLVGAKYYKAVVIMPGVHSPFSEFFMVEYRDQTANDKDYPTAGLVIWHVDSTLDAAGTNFLNDNSKSSHKLISLVEADGLGEIEHKCCKICTGCACMQANAGDFYRPPSTFGPATKPNSNNYAGSKTGVLVDQLTQPATVMAARFSIAS